MNNNYWISETTTSVGFPSYPFEEKEELECPNCLRIMPNKKHRRKHGCKWCVPIKPTRYCNGKY